MADSNYRAGKNTHVLGGGLFLWGRILACTACFSMYETENNFSIIASNCKNYFNKNRNNILSHLKTYSLISFKTAEYKVYPSSPFYSPAHLQKTWAFKKYTQKQTIYFFSVSSTQYYCRRNRMRTLFLKFIFAYSTIELSIHLHNRIVHSPTEDVCICVVLFKLKR